MTALRAIVVDDEPLAVKRIVDLLKPVNDIEVVATCSNGKLAVSAIKRLEPDLVFLDIQMPGLDGFGVMREIGVERMPVTVMVTAFDQYAVTAFEVNALDYLLKPFDRERFSSALDRARRKIARLAAERSQPKLQALLDTISNKTELERRILVKAADKISVIPVDQIRWIESAGNYVKLHAGGRSHLYREPLKSLERRLAEFGFVRIHRSTLLNVGEIDHILPHGHGDFVIVLTGGTRLTMSRRYRSRVEKHLSLPE